jgi:hypothetical protein
MRKARVSSCGAPAAPQWPVPWTTRAVQRFMSGEPSMRMEKPPNQLVLLSRTVRGLSPPPHWTATRAPSREDASKSHLVHASFLDT